MILEDEEEQEDDERDAGNGDDLAAKISLGPFLDGGGDSPHAVIAGGEEQDAADEPAGEEKSDDSATERHENAVIEDHLTKNHKGIAREEKSGG